MNRASDNTSQSRTLTDYARRWSRGILAPIAQFFHRMGIHPDAITLVGLALVLLSAITIVAEIFWLAGIVLLLGLPLDAVDGAVARLRLEARPFGAFFDSTLDRYADGLIFGALAVFGSQQESILVVILALISLVGAYMVSYTRARAEGLGIDCKVGLFSRLERLIVILLMLFTGWLLPGLWVLAIGTQFTVLQRIWHVRQQAATSASDA